MAMGLVRYLEHAGRPGLLYGGRHSSSDAMAYDNEDSFLDSSYEERTECDYYEEDARWEWTGRADWVEDEDEGDEDDCYVGAEISREELYACEHYNERFAY